MAKTRVTPTSSTKELGKESPLIVCDLQTFLVATATADKGPAQQCGGKKNGVIKPGSTYIEVTYDLHGTTLFVRKYCGESCRDRHKSLINQGPSGPPPPMPIRNKKAR
ncbi:MAG TPA: hypothetical protein VLK22_02065 [Candidatus Udaeobacter sp.]|nr:hypothetical protein [Candidatus Udaeobacter sp.]